MAQSINSVTLVGNLTRDPDSFSAGCTLGLAVNERVKENDDWVDRASFFEVTVFGKQADACTEYLAKGSPVAVQGNLRQDRWTNDSGDNRSKVKVIAQRVQFLSSRNGDTPKSDVPADDNFTQPEPQSDPAALLPAGKTEATEDNIVRFCICRGGSKSDHCPIAGHGIPF